MVNAHDHILGTHRVCEGWTGFEVDCTDPDAERIASMHTSETNSSTAWAQEVAARCGES